jgi:hypothetical protein
MEPPPALGFPRGAENRLAGNRTATDHADGFPPTEVSFPAIWALKAVDEIADRFR